MSSDPSPAETPTADDPAGSLEVDTRLPLRIWPWAALFLAALMLFQWLLWSTAGDGADDPAAGSRAGGIAALGAGAALFALIFAFARNLLADLVRATGTPGIDMAEESARRRALARVLVLAGGLAALVMAGLAVLAFRGLTGAEAEAPAMRVFLVGVLAGTVLLMISALVTLVPHFLRPLPSSGPQADDANWTLGLLYRAAEDPALWVRQRIGFGYTVNFAHPEGWRAAMKFVLAPVLIALALVLVA